MTGWVFSMGLSGARIDLQQRKGGGNDVLW